MSRGRAAAIERLRHMVEAADAIVGYVARGREAFDRDEALRESVPEMRTVIAAAVARLEATP